MQLKEIAKFFFAYCSVFGEAGMLMSWCQERHKDWEDEGEQKVNLFSLLSKKWNEPDRNEWKRIATLPKSRW